MQSSNTFFSHKQFISIIVHFASKVTVVAFNTQTKTMKYINTTLLLLFLAGCATPQERAISAYCGAEALRMYPQQLVSQQVLRSVYIGDKTVGNKNTCKTEIKESKDKVGTITKTRETICRDDPILEPVYQDQLVNEIVDVNSNQRQVKIANCEVVSKANGMFANVK